jgi:hypothetical protein
VRTGCGSGRSRRDGRIKREREEDSDSEGCELGDVDALKRRMLKVLAAGGAGSMWVGTAAAQKAQSDRAGGDLPGEGRGAGGRGRGFHPERDIPTQDGRPIPLTLYTSQLALHPDQDRAIFTTAIFDEGLQLYVADGISEPADPPTAVYRLTDADELVAAIEWLPDNYIEYDRGFVRYKRKLPPSHIVFEPSVVKEPSVEGVKSL